MNKFILFIQGGGDGGYEADKELVSSLQSALGDEYDIKYPEIQSDEAAPDFGWTTQISENITKADNNIILIGHSLGASMILKYLSENAVNKKIDGIFLLATPFWDGSEDWQTGLKLQENFADMLPNEVPIFFYHSQDDEEISISHLRQYKQYLSRATFRELKSGGHQLKNSLSIIANDIQSLDI